MAWFLLKWRCGPIYSTEINTAVNLKTSKSGGPRPAHSCHETWAHLGGKKSREQSKARLVVLTAGAEDSMLQDA